MKHMWKTLILVSLAVLLSSCTIQTVEQYESMRDEERSVQETEAPDETQHSSEDTQGESAKQESTKQEELAPNETALAPSTEPEKGDNAAAESPKEQPAATDTGGQKTSPTPAASTEPSPKPASTSKPQEQEPVQPKKRYVAIAIHAQTLLDNWDLLEPALQDEKYVPKDGVILAAAKYELLSEKETVWDILLRATKEYKIQLEYQGASSNIYNSVYVEGINHLYEFSAGSLSGWMYRVNGVFPSYGCDQYVLEDGDVIEWHYTVDLGRDLGTGV